MQETEFKGQSIQEFFTALTDKKVQKEMDNRWKVLESEGRKFIRRIKIRPRDICPCGSGLKFKNCCINKVDLSR